MHKDGSLAKALFHCECAEIQARARSTYGAHPHGSHGVEPKTSRRRGYVGTGSLSYRGQRQSQDGAPGASDHAGPENPDLGVVAQEPPFAACGHGARRTRSRVELRWHLRVGCLDLHGQQLAILLEDEVDFLAGTEAPVIQLASRRPVTPEEQVARDPRLEMEANRRSLA